MWIDAKEGFPVGGVDVLVYTDYGYTVAHFDSRARNWRNENDRPLRVTVTHWMDLPTPPSEHKPNEPERARTCGHCKNWRHGECCLPRSPKFTDTTNATDGCVPNKRGRADWI